MIIVCISVVSFILALIAICSLIFYFRNKQLKQIQKNMEEFLSKELNIDGDYHRLFSWINENVPNNNKTK